jgi:hypothetical protein
MPSPDDLPGALDPSPIGAGTALDAQRNGHSGSNGHAGPDPRRVRRGPGPSTKPALVVLGLTMVLFVVGIALELASGNQSRPVPAPTSIATARGAVLHAVAARPLLHAVVTTDQPPDDLLNALAVPEGAAPVPNSATNRGVELYDRSIRFEVPATEQDVISFFRAQLPALHWHRLSEGPAAKVPGYLILEQHPASDGHEWEIGVTISPTVFGPSPAPGTPTTVPTTGTTSFTLRLFAVSDQA